MSKNPLWMRKATARAQSAIANRLRELGSDPFKAAEKVGLARTYIYEFLTGKKHGFGSGKLSKVAEALDWHVSELSLIVSDSRNSD